MVYMTYTFKQKCSRRIDDRLGAIDVEGYSKTSNFDNTRLSAAVTVTPADVH